MSAAWAVVGDRLLTGLVEVSRDPSVLDRSGRWVVVLGYDRSLLCARFDRDEPAGPWLRAAPRWQPPPRGRWHTSLDRDAYCAGVETIRAAIVAGDVYQANLCRILSTDDAGPGSAAALAAALRRGNPAPYACAVVLPDHDVAVVSASPELFLRRDGDTVSSGPIKGTGRSVADLTAKDEAENVMIVDLVRNDLSIVALPGSVTVPSLLRVEEHPGLVHLVSTVNATLAAGCGWAELLAATAPPASVTGAPKSSALRIIDELETQPRGTYCGAVGWVDADQRRAVLAVAIRTFEWRGGRLQLGTGAGITWGSDPAREWDETELKVSRLLEVR